MFHFLLMSAKFAFQWPLIPQINFNKAPFLSPRGGNETLFTFSAAGSAGSPANARRANKNKLANEREIRSSQAQTVLGEVVAS